MSQHNKTDFKHFTKAEMDDGLRLHGLEESKPSQLSDGFRSGAEWGASAVLAALVQRAPVEPLQRWGRSENLCLRLLDPMDDGYWTPWHIATEAIAQQRAKIEALSAEVERMKAPAELGFAMRAMTKTLDGLDVPYEEQLQIVPGLWQECMKERDQLRAQLEAQGEAVAVVESDAPGGIAWTPAGLELVDGQELFTHPAPAAPVVTSAIEAAIRWHQGDKWRGTDKHGEWEAQMDLLNAANAALQAAPAQVERLQWCEQCGEGVVNFCRGKGEKCGYGFPKPGQPEPAQPVNQALVDAVGKLIKAKGRYHTEQNYKALVAAYDAALAQAQAQQT